MPTPAGSVASGVKDSFFNFLGVGKVKATKEKDKDKDKEKEKPKAPAAAAAGPYRRIGRNGSRPG